MIKGQNLSDSFVAGQAFATTDQYKFVKMDSSATDTDLQVDACGADAAAIGTIQTAEAAAGDSVSVAHGGVVKAMAGAAVALNATCKTDSSGRAITVTTDFDPIVCRALTAATAAGDIILVKLVDAVHGV